MRTLYFHPVVTFFFFFSSPNLSRHRLATILPHMVWPLCEFRMHVWNVLHMAISKYRTQKNRHLGTIAQLCSAISSQLRHVLTTGKKLVKQQYLLHMVIFSPLTAEMCWQVWGTPANFNRFCVLALLLHQRRSTEVNQSLHDVWPSPGLVHYIYILGGLAPNGILPAA